VRGLLVDAAAEAARVMDEARRILEDLRPLDLEDVDLPGAIRRLVFRLDRSGTVITTEMPDGPLRSSPATDVAAYRIVGECLTNALRHARARHVAVRLRADGDDLVVEVSDDGVGLVDAVASGRGVGTASVIRRAEEIGGRCAFLTRPDTSIGTLVRASLPRLPTCRSVVRLPS
jgi:signal transduction histidine kinase